MSRETKFRVWDIEAKKMRHIIMNLKYALHGLIACQWCDGATLDNHWLQNDADCVGGKERFILIEHTGLKDKNNKDLDWWEDDLLRKGSQHPNNPIARIVYDEQLAQWNIVGTSGNPFCTLAEAYTNGWYKVGNIHQNPKLLKQAAIAKGTVGPAQRTAPHGQPETFQSLCDKSKNPLPLGSE